MELGNGTWTEVEKYLASKKSLIIPIGSTEQHGPTALIGTDYMTAEAIAKKVGELTETFVAPTLNYGMANHHLGFPGSASLNPSTFIQMNCDLMDSWVGQGFDTFIYINGHGGNIAPLNCAASELKRKHQNIKVGVFDWWHLKEVTDYEQKHFGNENGKHATCGEVSVTQYVNEEAFKNIKPQMFEVKPANHHWPLSASEMKHYHPDGRMDSNPGLANKEHGKKLYEIATNSIAQRIKDLGYV